MMAFRIGGCAIKFVQGDITEQETEAIVNAANSTLMGGGGVDGAIHRRGGPTILDDCKKVRATMYPDGLPTGKAVITGGGKLKAKFVIHTVGPVWRGGTEGEAEYLAQCYLSALAIARERGITSVAFPSIGTGAYGYPVDQAAKVAIATVTSAVAGTSHLKEVVFVLFSHGDFEEYVRTASSLFGLSRSSESNDSAVSRNEISRNK